MTAFVAAVVDTLLPGDSGERPLPPASAVGTHTRVMARLASAPARDALAAIAAAAGGEEAFVLAALDERAAVARHVERNNGAAFRSLVLFVASDYYENEAVLAAFGWRGEPPQPSGHTLAPFEDALLASVRQRGRR